jgi:hypothetical protein
MSKTTYIQLAPIALKPGVSETQLLQASDMFDKAFVKKQDGIIRRHLLRAKTGGYADLVFFESKQAADKVRENEMSSPNCAAFFSIMEVPDETAVDMGVLSFEPIKTYE